MSITYIGIIVSGIAFLMDKANIQIAQPDIENAVTTIVVIIGGIVALYGRFRKGDLTLWGSRK